MCVFQISVQSIIVFRVSNGRAAILESGACAKPHKSLESLKQSLRREWDKITVMELRRIAENFIRRLELCIRNKGGHFEDD